MHLQSRHGPGHQRCMLILFDHSVPAPLRHALSTHVVVEAVERGWETLDNGALLEAAEAEGFDALVTADKNIRYQQSLAGRRIAVIILGNAQWPILRRHVGRVVAAVNQSMPGSYIEVEIPTS